MGVSQDAGPFVPGKADLSELREAAAGCRGCPLYERATRTVFGEGPAAARLMLVGEQPGDQEDRQGRPFVGPAGRLLGRALAEAGIERDAVYLTNAVKHFKFTCKEGSKRRFHQSPGATEINACRPWLVAELETVSPEVVVALGAVAGRALLGPSFRVTRQRGVPLDCPPFEAIGAPANAQGPPAGRIVATIHPSAVLRAPDRDSVYAGFVGDLAVAARLLG
ncbi:UdgX family uracil-DNA binding protein [Actinocorallia populi]|uniref:UdgX family uracil-DNA binding protein n=1 Tax=Actinocorallia populi TaxID=2079200 RepID=UPI000D09687B|nr:UdgX family uracil-DNA binding protein [Actinocorallia populi]